MGPPSCMWSIFDRNVVMRLISVKVHMTCNFVIAEISECFTQTPELVSEVTVLLTKLKKCQDLSEVFTVVT
jgi:hypothetical protein